MSCVQRYRQHSTPINDSTLNVYTSTITAWLHMKPLNASINPATQPLTTAKRLAKCSSMPSNQLMLSTIRDEARLVSNASRPLESAAATADDNATRNAMFEIGTSSVNSHVYSVQTGYPGGCGTPAYIEATASSPLSSSVKSGEIVRQYPKSAIKVVIANASQSTGRKKRSPAANAWSVFSHCGIKSGLIGFGAGLVLRGRVTRSFFLWDMNLRDRAKGGLVNNAHRRKSIPESGRPLPVATATGTVRAMSLPHKLATLLYCFDPDDRLLLLKRHQPPNLGRWVPPGGKVEVAQGESPYACACREAQEEAGLEITTSDLHLTGLISEDAYEGNTHWYIFLFEIMPRLKLIPAPCEEGEFQFFTANEIGQLDIPRTDREQIWPLFQKHRGGFFSGHFHCIEGDAFEWTLEESRHATATQHE